MPGRSPSWTYSPALLDYASSTSVNALETEALDWLRQRDDREFSFVDATSFATMPRLAIRSALAFDGDFAAAGFVELR